MTSKKDVDNLLNNLKESEGRYRNLVETLPDAIFVYNPAGRFVFVNRAGLRLLGAKKEKDVIGKSLLDFVHSTYKKSVSDIIRGAAKKDVNRFDLEVKLVDGRLLHLEVTATPIMFEGEKARQVVVRDVSEEKFRVLSEESPNIIFINKRGRIAYANRKAMEDMGYTRKEFYSPDFDFMSLIAPDSMDLVRKNFEKHAKGEDIPPHEYTLLTKEGKEIIAIHTTKLIDYEGEKAILGIVTDITERKKADVALKQHTEELAGLLKVSQEIASTLDMDKILQTAINEAVKLTNLDTGAIYLIEDAGMLHLKATTPPLPPDFPEGLRHMRMNDHPHIMKAIKTRRPLILADTAKASLTYAEQEVTKLRGLRTLLYVPLIGKEEAMGVFIVGSIGESCVISESQIKLCNTLANQSALAVKNSRLYVETLNAKRTIQESEERYQTLFRQSPVGIGISNLEGRIIDANQAMMEIVGAKAADDLKTINIIDTYVDLVQRKELLDKIGKSGYVRGFEVRLKRLNGEVYDALLNVTKVKLHDKHVFLTTARDITEIKRSAEMLRESQEFLKSIVDNSGEAIVITNMEGRITLWSKGAEGMYGFKGEEVLGKGIDFLYPDELKEDRRKWQEDVIKGRTVRDIRTRIYNSKGELVDIDLTLSALVDKDGKRSGTIGISKDIRDRIESEHRLQEKMAELERWQRLTVGREVRMVELKKEIAELKKKIK